MFDIGASELLLIVVVAIVVIGPKDLPLALRTAGRWIGQMRRISGHFRSGIETMIREAEMEEMERKWREQNAAIMAASPSEETAPSSDVNAEARIAANSSPAESQADSATPDGGTALTDRSVSDAEGSGETEPELPLAAERRPHAEVEPEKAKQASPDSPSMRAE